MSNLTLEVQEREAGGKNANRRLRVAGKVPAVVYGGGLDPKTIVVDERSLRDVLRGTADDNPIFLLKLGDKSRHTMIKEMQTDPITGKMVHIDFLRVNMDVAVTVSVQIVLHGTPDGVKNEGGMLDFVTREVEITCLPGKIPGHLDVDVSSLHVGQHIEASHLTLPDGVKLETEPDRVLVSVHGKAAEEAPAEAEEAAVEPEVLTKRKVAEE